MSAERATCLCHVDECPTATADEERRACGLQRFSFDAQLGQPFEFLLKGSERRSSAQLRDLRIPSTSGHAFARTLWRKIEERTSRATHAHPVPPARSVSHFPPASLFLYLRPFTLHQKQLHSPCALARERDRGTRKGIKRVTDFTSRAASERHLWRSRRASTHISPSAVLPSCHDRSSRQWISARL